MLQKSLIYILNSLLFLLVLFPVKVWRFMLRSCRQVYKPAFFLLNCLKLSYNTPTTTSYQILPVFKMNGRTFSLIESSRLIPYAEHRTIKAAPLCISLLPKDWEYMASNEPIQKPGRPFSDLFQQSYLRFIATQVGLDRHHLAQPLTVFQEKCHVGNAKRNSFVFFLESLLFFSTLGKIKAIPLKPYLPEKYAFGISTKTKRFQMTKAPNLNTHWKFFRTETLLSFMSPKLNQKLSSRQNPVTPRAGLSNLRPRNVLGSHSKILLQTRGPQLHNRLRELKRKRGPEGIRFMRLRKPHMGKYLYAIPNFLPKSIPFYLEWTPGPIKWSTDDTDAFFKSCHRRELELAARLGLSCQQYLDSKKRIFYTRIIKARRGLQMRKIDAQHACRIHYKKAGSLYTAFKSVGLLKRNYLELYIKCGEDWI